MAVPVTALDLRFSGGRIDQYEKVTAESPEQFQEFADSRIGRYTQEAGLSEPQVTAKAHDPTVAGFRSPSPLRATRSLRPSRLDRLTVLQSLDIADPGPWSHIALPHIS